MPREKEAYRDNLELILEFMKNKYDCKKMMMNNKDIQEFTGLKYKYVKENYMDGQAFVSVAVFARKIS